MAERAILSLLDPRRKFKSEYDSKLMRETIEPLMTGYLRKGGLSVGLRALLRITTDQNFRETWTKDLEHFLSKENELSRKELKEKVANGVDLDVLRSRGATEHELEVAGVQRLGGTQNCPRAFELPMCHQLAGVQAGGRLILGIAPVRFLVAGERFSGEVQLLGD